MIGADADAAVADLGRVTDSVTTAVWEGETGNAFRVSTGRLVTRSETVGPAARGVEQALTTLASAMVDARTRHQRAEGIGTQPWAIANEMSAAFDEVQDAGGDETEWQRDEATPEEESALAAVNADPWVREISLTVGAATLATDDASRRAPTGQVELTDRSVSELVDDLDDWELTWASCARGRPVELTARCLAGPAPARRIVNQGTPEATVSESQQVAD